MTAVYNEVGLTPAVSVLALDKHLSAELEDYVFFALHQLSAEHFH